MSQVNTVRAKLVVTSVAQCGGWSGKPDPDYHMVKLQTVYDETIPEDRRFYDATPSGEFEMMVNNQAALKQFKLGQAFYVDFIPVEEPTDA